MAPVKMIADWSMVPLRLDEMVSAENQKGNKYEK